MLTVDRIGGSIIVGSRSTDSVTMMYGTEMSNVSQKQSQGIP